MAAESAVRENIRLLWLPEVLFGKLRGVYGSDATSLYFRAALYSSIPKYRSSTNFFSFHLRPGRGTPPYPAQAGGSVHLAMLSQPLEELKSLRERILDLLQTATEPLKCIDMRSRLRIKNQRLGLALTTLEQQGALKRTPEGTARTWEIKAAFSKKWHFLEEFVLWLQ